MTIQKKVPKHGFMASMNENKKPPLRPQKNKKMTKHSLYLLLILLTFTACNKDDDAPEGSLQAYIEANADWKPFNELVACAAGGQVGFLDDAASPLSMFFYPKPYSTNFRYYETASTDDAPNDLSLFIEKDVADEPLFNGFMKRFLLPQPSTDKWARVSYVSNDTLWYCKPVRIKYNAKPSQYAPELCEADLTNPLEPIFTWEDGTADDNVIYYQVISDERGDALSATYTTDYSFQFYNTDNVVFNVTRPGPVLPLQPNKEYGFVLMGVSDDNWVNLIITKSFVTE